MALSISTPYGTFPLTRDSTKFITVYKSPEGNRWFTYKGKQVKPGDLVFTEHKKVGGAIHSPQTFVGCNKLGTFDLEGKLVTARETDQYDGDDRTVDAEALAKGLEDLRNKTASGLIGLPDPTEQDLLKKSYLTPADADAQLIKMEDQKPTEVEREMSAQLREADDIINTLLRLMEDVPGDSLERKIVTWKAKLGIHRDTTYKPTEQYASSRFRFSQYCSAIVSLVEAMEQLEPDGRCCTCCGDSGHQAFECGHNPLVAVALCVAIAKDARELHDKLHAQEQGEDLKALNETNRLQADSDKLHELVHYLAGFDSYMGCTRGPAKVVAPK